MPRPRMRRVGVGLLTTLLLVLTVGSSAGATVSGPTPRQVRAAIRAASRSPLLWATINLCDVHGDHSVGIRGQMPALPFPSRLVMTVTVREWSPTAHRFVSLEHRYRVGGQVFSRGSVVQDGVQVRFRRPVTVIGLITFTWTRDGRVLGSTRRLTRGGHRGAHGTPAGFSASGCTVA